MDMDMMQDRQGILDTTGHWDRPDPIQVPSQPGWKVYEESRSLDNNDHQQHRGLSPPRRSSTSSYISDTALCSYPSSSTRLASPTHPT